MVEAGAILAIRKGKMTSDDKDDNEHKLKQVIGLLKFALSLDDEEIVKSTIESVIDLLQEMVE